MHDFEFDKEILITTKQVYRQLEIVAVTITHSQTLAAGCINLNICMV